MTVRCKFQLSEIREHAYSKAKTFVFTPNYDNTIEEDRRFYTASPSGRFEILVDNPAVFEKWKIGSYYYFDAIPIT